MEGLVPLLRGPCPLPLLPQWAKLPNAFSVCQEQPGLQRVKLDSKGCPQGPLQCLEVCQPGSCSELCSGSVGTQRSGPGLLVGETRQRTTEETARSEVSDHLLGKEAGKPSPDSSFRSAPRC